MPAARPKESSRILEVHSTRLVRGLSWAVGALVAVHLLGLIPKHVLGHDTLLGLLPLINMDGEMSLPAWFSSMLLLVCSALLGLIALDALREKEPFRRYWLGLALIFLYLSADEAASIHEKATTVMRYLFGVKGFLYYHGWLVPGSILLAAFLLVYARFLKALPRSTRGNLLLAGGIYVAGAVLGEVVSGVYEAAWGRDVLYSLLTTAEETLEMAGLVLLIRALLGHLSDTVGRVDVRFGKTR